MRTKATSLSIRSEKISAFTFALEYQKIDSYKRLELQTKELSIVRSAVHPVSRVRSLGFSFVRFRRRALGGPFTFLVCLVVPPFAQFFLLFMSINML